MNLEKAISHPDKLYWPDDGYTKLDLARFYDRIFPKLKPYITGRPLSLERCPDGMLGQCFYQKEAPKGLPARTPTQLLHHEKKDVNYVIGGSCETQIALVNLGCIPVHIWQSRAATPQQPDWIVFDMDPISGVRRCRESRSASKGRARPAETHRVSQNFRKPWSARDGTPPKGSRSRI